MKMVEMLQDRGMLYKLVAQTVLIYGSDSWVGTVLMVKVFGGFHHRASQRIMGMTAWCVEEGEW